MPVRGRRGSHGATEIAERARFFAGLIGLALVSATIWLAVWATVAPAVLGWSPVAVTSGSMAPLIDTGDVVVVAPSEGDELRPGTVVVFDDPTGRRVTHRIVAVAPDGRYVTRGDANRRIDSTPVAPEQIVGVGRLLVPGAGRPAVWINDGQWAPVAIATIVLVAVSWASRWALLRPFNPWRRRQTVPSVPGRRRSLRASTALAGLTIVGLTATVIVARTDAAFVATTTNTANSLDADILAPPTGVSATGTGPVTIDWTATVDLYASGHRVLRATTSGGPYTQIAEVTPRTTISYVDNPGAGTYYYVVRAFHSNWESADSAEAVATVGGAAGIAFDNGTGSGHFGGFLGVMSTTFDHALNSGSGSDRVLIVNVAHEDANVTGITYNTVAMTPVASVTTQAFARSTMYVMTDSDLPATAGTYTVEITFADSAKGTAGAVSFTGVDQITPHDSAVTGSGATGTPSVSVSSEADDLVVDTYAWRENENLTEGGGQTENYASTGGEPANGSSREAGAATVTMNYTSPGMNSKNWSQIGVNLNAAP